MTFSRLSEATLAGLCDELEKISEVNSRGSKFKKWSKNTALHVAGVGAGTAAFMAAEKIIGNRLGATWNAMGPKMRLAIAGGVGLASSLVAMKLLDAKSENTSK